MTVLLLKLLLAPALVVGSSLAGRRWGPPVAGMLVALPIVAGPILLITGIEHGAPFVARAAAAALLGLMSLALFAAVYAWLSRWFGWVVTLAISWAVCLGADLALSTVSVGPGWGLILVLAVASAAARLLPAVEPAGDRRPSWPWWDLPGRAVATAALVLLVTALATTVGPRLTGVLAPFPIATSVVAAFAQAQHGPGAAIGLLRGVPRGLLGFSVFCCLVAVLAEPAGTLPAFAIALTGTLVVQLLWRTALNRRTTRRTGPTGPEPVRADATDTDAATTPAA